MPFSSPGAGTRKRRNGGSHSPLVICSSPRMASSLSASSPPPTPTGAYMLEFGSTTSRRAAAPSYGLPTATARPPPLHPRHSPSA
uniref:Uncharacterized protein n=1 Tax=Triticum urartu TaxID=4572 RepID=A0A8R7TND2_TRIUA